MAVTGVIILLIPCGFGGSSMGSVQVEHTVGVGDSSHGQAQCPLAWAEVG